MRDSSKFISVKVESQIPQFIRLTYPNFVEFLKKYYEWLEEQGKPYHFIANAMDFANVDRTTLEFLERFAKNFLQPLPEVINDQNDIALLVKNIEQYYSARGSEKAFQFMFRLFEFKDDADHELSFYYPSEDILRVSDGKWIQEQSFKIIDPPEGIEDWATSLAVGKDSNAKAVIDYVKIYQSDSGINIAEIYLQEFDILHRPNKFQIGEEVEITTRDGEIHTITLERVFADIEITNPGKWNIENQRIDIASTSGENARAVIKTVSPGTITGFSIVLPGTGYKVGERVYTESSHDFGMGAYGTISEVGPNGEILKIKVMSLGNGYRHDQKVKVLNSEGKGAEIFIESDDIGQVIDTEVRDFGINYETDTTTLTFNTVLRVYDIFIGWEIGEKITGSSGAEAIVEYWNKDSNVVSVRMLSGSFSPGETITGERDQGTATIYDINTPEGKLIEGCVCHYEGRYLNMDGHISSLKYIQDSYFYQMFSYLVETKRDKTYWQDYVKNVHPAGTIGFSLNDIIIQYEKELTTGIIGPIIDTTEFYKFRWTGQQYHGGNINNNGSTQIKQYKDIPIDEIANIHDNKVNKNWFCFGAEITIEPQPDCN
jgi:hypothetical protein